MKPPNGQGIAALLALNMLSELERTGAVPPLSRETLFHGGGGGEGSEGGGKPLPVLHALIEVMRLAFADTRAFVGDPAFGSGIGGSEVVPTAALLSEAYAARRVADGAHGGAGAAAATAAAAAAAAGGGSRGGFSRDRAAADTEAGRPEGSSCTVSFQVVDGEGNAVSMVNSNYMGFGTGLVPKGFGFTLQNRGHNFSLEVSE
jgi:gamma-glutamyltranspeptidase/glutathione hydrolase